jgi:hypothetical protein
MRFFIMPPGDAPDATGLSCRSEVTSREMCSEMLRQNEKFATAGHSEQASEYGLEANVDFVIFFVIRKTGTSRR